MPIETDQQYLERVVKEQAEEIQQQAEEIERLKRLLDISTADAEEVLEQLAEAGIIRELPND